MKNYADIGLQIPDILLPTDAIDANAWAVVACDQFTSEPDYWHALESHIGEKPSTLKMILPEAFLEQGNIEERIQASQKVMQSYIQKGILTSFEGFVLVERTLTHEGRETKRFGLVAALDLEQYDYSEGSQSLIRATEGTIIDRLPPRMKIRRNAPVELPHILVLLDDPEFSVIEPLAQLRDELPVAYDTDLFGEGGYLKGYKISDNAKQSTVIEALRGLVASDHFAKKYELEPGKFGTLLYAMGDGNHSLATAKAIWEEIKGDVGMDHPARYALVELENIHSPALVFEPIHRIITGVRGDFLKVFGEKETFQSTKCHSLTELTTFVDTPTTDGSQRFGLLSPDGYYAITVLAPSMNLPVGTLQAFLDQWKAAGAYEAIDYVHGTDVIAKLSHKPGHLGFYLPAMGKSDLFKTVILDGSLPRKTFSMGEANEKRYYFECRKITAE